MPWADLLPALRAYTARGEKMAHPRLTRSQRRRSRERSHRRRWLRVKRDNGNRLRDILPQETLGPLGRTLPGTKRDFGGAAVPGLRPSLGEPTPLRGSHPPPRARNRNGLHELSERQRLSGRPRSAWRGVGPDRSVACRDVLSVHNARRNGESPDHAENKVRRGSTAELDPAPRMEEGCA